MSSIGGVGGSRNVDLPSDSGATPAATTGSASTASNVSRTPSTARVTTPATAPASAVTAPATSGVEARTSALADKVSVGTMEGSGSVVTLDAASGKFSSKRTTGSYESASTALYRAAELVATGKTSFLTDPKLGASGRLKLTQTLEAAIKQGNGATGTPRQADLQARSGAATLSLEMAKGLPASDPLKGRLVAAYVAQLGVEKQRGLQASMVLNLEEAVKKGQVKLTSSQAAELAKAKEATFPSKPPYDSWFKGNDKLNMRHYIHHEFFEQDCRDYEELGFKKTVLGPGRYLFEKQIEGQNGKKMPVRVECFNVSDEPEGADQHSMSKIFGDMKDPNVQIEFYGGHSNLGGNVLGALAANSSLQRGDKWVVNWMCRGQQVLADVYNKFPDAHYSTTTTPVYANGPKLLDSMFQGIAKRESYDQIQRRYSSDWQSKNLMFPNDPRILTVRDIDRDGQVDIGTKGVDPLWNTGLTRTSNEKRDLKPVANAKTPQDIQGDKIMRGVNFANTILEYHKEHANDGRIPDGVSDKVTAGGWFADPSSNDLCRITERKVGGTTYYDVQVNSKFAGQEANAIGAAMMYELNRHLTKKHNGGQYTEQDKLRGAVFAGEFCAYMAESYEQVDDVMGAIADRYGFPSKLTWDNVNKAMDVDGDGYATPKQVSELKRIIGTVDPRNG
jgi:hypothetical protein